MKKYIIILTLFALLLPLLGGCGGGGGSFELPARTLTEGDAGKFGVYEYSVYDDNTVVITAYGGSESNVVIPGNIEGRKVVALGEAAFSENSAIRSVRCNAELEIIGDYTFYGCEQLSDISFGKKLWAAGFSAFDGTPWLAAQTEDFVIIGDGLLLKYQGGANSVTVPAGVRHLSCAFSMNADIINVDMGDDVMTVGKSAFAYCSSLCRVGIGKNVVLIGDGAFDGCESLTALDIPDSVLVIGEYAFNYCTMLTDVHIGGSVRSIGRYAFRSCQRIKTMTLPATLEDIGSYAFADCFSLMLVYYGGSEEQFAALTLDSTNYLLKDTEKLYNTSGGTENGTK